jgi:hypothetical protein
MVMKIESKKQTKFERFDDLTRKLLSVPHEEIKKALDKEKEAKKRKRKKLTSSASRAAGDKD